MALATAYDQQLANHGQATVKPQQGKINSEADVSSVSPSSERIRRRANESDEGLTLETSASESLYGGQFTLSILLIKPNYLVILPPTQHHSFFRNLPPL